MYKNIYVLWCTHCYYICILECTHCYRIAEKVWRGKVWQIDFFQAFGERKFGELIDQPIGY